MLDEQVEGKNVAIVLCLPEVTGLVKPILFLEMTLQIEQSSQSSGRFIAFGVLGATQH
jgi:hypothetical protein